jgi:hypothetical protein
MQKARRVISTKTGPACLSSSSVTDAPVRRSQASDCRGSTAADRPTIPDHGKLRKRFVAPLRNETLLAKPKGDLPD